MAIWRRNVHGAVTLNKRGRIARRSEGDAMIRGRFAAPQGGLVMFQALSRRQRLARRRVLVIAAMAGLALTAGVIGAVVHEATIAPVSGPFSYFPS
jgi:hypothetical protein